MKRSIKQLSLGLVFLSIIMSCNTGNAETKETNNKNADGVEVYYFHFTRRCATCNAVEDRTKEFLKDLYPQQMEKEVISFSSINLDESSSEDIAKQIGVNSQALIFKNGDEKVNLTSEAFMNARSNPDKLKALIKETVDNMLQE